MQVRHEARHFGIRNAMGGHRSDAATNQRGDLRIGMGGNEGQQTRRTIATVAVASVTDGASDLEGAGALGAPRFLSDDRR